MQRHENVNCNSKGKLPYRVDLGGRWNAPCLFYSLTYALQSNFFILLKVSMCSVSLILRYCIRLQPGKTAFQSHNAKKVQPKGSISVQWDYEGNCFNLHFTSSLLSLHEDFLRALHFFHLFVCSSPFLEAITFPTTLGGLCQHSQL